MAEATIRKEASQPINHANSTKCRMEVDTQGSLALGELINWKGVILSLCMMYLYENES